MILIFLDIIHKFNMTLFKGKMSNFFFYFTYNHGKFSWFYLLSEGHMYTRPPMGVAPSPSVGVEEKLPGYLCFKDYIDGVPADIRK